MIWLNWRSFQRVVFLPSVGKPIDPVFTAEGAENAELLLKLCGLSVLRGETNTVQRDNRPALLVPKASVRGTISPKALIAHCTLHIDHCALIIDH